MQTHSKKNNVTTNKLLINSEFKDKTNTEKRDDWAWARSSTEVKEVRKLQNDFLETVKQTKQIAIIKKQKLKLEKTLKTMKQL